MSRGVLVIISSPSGAGKTTLARRLMTEFPALEFSVSFTTRPMRPGEVDGKDYRFVSQEVFDKMVADDQFAEWALVHNNYYGTAKEPVDRALNEARHVVFDVDWQGGRALSKQWPDDSLKIFILPPSVDELSRRLRSRASDSESVIEARLAKAREEMAHYDEYDFLIVNDDVDKAYATLRAVYLTRIGTPTEDELVKQTTSREAKRQAESLVCSDS